VGVTFKEVGGADEAIGELQEIIQFLKTPQRFARLGRRIPKGVLLIGLPVPARPSSRRLWQGKPAYDSSRRAAQSSRRCSSASGSDVRQVLASAERGAAEDAQPAQGVPDTSPNQGVAR
jgi:hypothetical protein